MVSTESHVKWLDRATYDLDTAKAMLQTGRLIYAIFMCQQFLEKCFKALLSYQGKEIIPIHNLRRLAELSVGLYDLNPDALIKLDFLSSYYINARYKEDLQQLSRGITETTAQDFIHFMEDFVRWLCQKMK